MATGRLSKAACSSLRSDLRDLGCLGADSEARRSVGRRLYPVSVHLLALDPSMALVTGPRGAGKSSLFHALFGQHDADDLVAAMLSRVGDGIRVRLRPDHAEWVGAFPVDGEFPAAGALARSVATSEEARELWRLMLVRRLAPFLDDAQKDLLEPVLRPAVTDPSKLLKAAGDLDADVLAALERLDARLQAQDRWVFVGYDELETIGGRDWALGARLVRGLLAFWAESSRRWRRIRAKIFLRSDLLRRHGAVSASGFARLAANRVELTWSDAALLGLLAKRMANASPGLADYCRAARIGFDEDERLGLVPRIDSPERAHRLIERLAGEYMGVNRKRGLVRNWVFDHLRDGGGAIAPRNFVRLFEVAAAKDSTNRALRPPRILHSTALREALDDVSVEHVMEGRRGEMPWLEGVQRRLAEEPLSPWPPERMLGLLEADWDGVWGGDRDSRVRPPEAGAEDLLELLVELGIFRRRADDWLDVPGPYLHGLGLRRRGGVKVGRHRGRR